MKYVNIILEDAMSSVLIEWVLDHDFPFILLNILYLYLFINYQTNYLYMCMNYLV